MSDTQQRTAVISGGGTGIGAAIARTLADDGYDVVLIGRRASVLEKTAATLPSALAIPADLTSPAAVEAVAEKLAGRTIDVVINNAGGFITRESDRLADVATQWQQTYEANVTTALLLTTALLPQMRKPDGRIILLSSIAAQRGGGGPYSAAKAALHGWGLDLAVQLGPQGITVNVIAPGYVTDTEFFGDRLTPDGHAARVGATLVGRAGMPDDIAHTVRWLVGPSSGYVTGQIIGVNGGSVLGR